MPNSNLKAIQSNEDGSTAKRPPVGNPVISIDEIMPNDDFMATAHAEVRRGITNFINNMQQNVAEIDPDTTRFSDVMGLGMINAGRPVHQVIYNFPNLEETDATIVMRKLIEYTGHFSFTGKNFYRGMLMDKGVLDEYSGIYYPGMYVIGGRTNDRFMLVMTGDEQLVRSWENYFTSTFKGVERIEIHTLTGFGQNGPVINSQTTERDKVTLAKEEFYPWLDVSIADFADKFIKSKAGLLYLYGIWGSGKTTLMRTIAFFAGAHGYKNIFLCVDENLTAHPAFVQWAGSLPPKSILLVEDAREILLPREKGNSSMSAMLNAIDGVVQNGLKVVLSSNLHNTTSVDTALLRPGRCYKEIKFTTLTPEDANNARVSIGLPEVDFSDFPSNDDLTLSVALNYEEIAEKNKASAAPIKAGFVS